MLNAWHLPVAPFVKQHNDKLTITLWLSGENPPSRVTLRSEFDNEEISLAMRKQRRQPQPGVTAWRATLNIALGQPRRRYSFKLLWHDRQLWFTPQGFSRFPPARLDMGVLEKRQIDSLTEEEEGWRRQLVNGTQDGRIPGGESMQELSDRVHAALASCLELPQGSRPLLVSHGIALGCLVSTILGLPAWAERRLRLRNCSISRIDYQESQWLASGWVVETAGDVSHLDAPALDELQR